MYVRLFSRVMELSFHRHRRTRYFDYTKCSLSRLLARNPRPLRHHPLTLLVLPVPSLAFAVASMHICNSYLDVYVEGNLRQPITIDARSRLETGTRKRLEGSWRVDLRCKSHVAIYRSRLEISIASKGKSLSIHSVGGMNRREQRKETTAGLVNRTSPRNLNDSTILSTEKEFRWEIFRHETM